MYIHQTCLPIDVNTYIHAYLYIHTDLHELACLSTQTYITHVCIFHVSIYVSLLHICMYTDIYICIYKEY